MSDRPDSSGGEAPYPDWQHAALGGNLLSYAWQHRPEMKDLVPGYTPDESLGQKVLDYGSVPARVAAAPILQGGDAFRRWMAGDQGADTRNELTSSLLGIMGGGLGREAPGPASFGAWHGSRHLFAGTPENPLGAFKPIEEVAHTGEGTQAFAFGHYVAGAQGTARSYMRAGAEDLGQGTYKLDDKEVTPLHYFDSNNPAYWGLHFLADHEGDHTLAIKDLRMQAKSLYNEAMTTTGEQKQGYLQNALDYSKASRWLDENRDRVTYEPPEKGHLYQVSVRPDEHELLDWDKPYSEQSPQVQQAVRPFFPYHKIDDMTGESLYRNIGAGAGGSEAASKALHDAGVPGVRFLDQNSRGIKVTPSRELNASGDPDQWHVTNEGSGWNQIGESHLASHDARADAEAHAESLRTRNYVIFHHSNLKITDRDGVAHGLFPTRPLNYDPWAAQAGATP